MKTSTQDFLRSPWLIGLFVLLFPLSTSWLADGLNGQCLWVGLLPACSGCAHWIRVLIALALAVFSLVAIWLGSRHLLGVRHLRPAKEVKPHKVLIAAMSPLGYGVVDLPGGGLGVAGLGDRDPLPLSGQLKADIDLITEHCEKGFWGKGYWNGQQFLRAIHEHASVLKHLMLLGSQDPRGSFSSLGSYEKLCALYLPSVEVVRWREPVEFEDIRAMSDAIRGCVADAETRGYQQDDLMIDVTGGYKTASIAAALTTLDYADIEFQYVQNNGKVISFNVVVATRSSYSGI